MDRRALLAALGTVTAGCIGMPGAVGPSDRSGTGSPPSEPGTGFRVTDFAVSTAKVAPTKRYYVRITGVYSADAVEDEPGTQTVVDVSEVADSGVREALKQVLREGKVRRDEIPDGLEETTERVDFFTWDARTDPSDTASHWGVAVYRAYPDRAPVVEFDAVSPGDPGAVALSLTNVGDRTQTVGSGTVPPFGILRAEGAGGRVVLWRAYEEEGCVTVTDDGMAVCSIGELTPVEPGQTIEKEYGVRVSPPVGDDLAAGDYVVADTLSYHREGEMQGPSVEVEWAVEFSVERT